jgi:hypothetical protein
MAQAISRRPVMAETQVRSQVSPPGICGEESSNWSRVFFQYFRFAMQRHSTNIQFIVILILWKGKDFRTKKYFGRQWNVK